MTLDVVIATYLPDGIKRVSQMFLPEIEGVNYRISWQGHNNYPIPDNLIRKDIHIYRYDGKGLSSNRNNAIEKSDADLIYIADDDIQLMPDALEKIRKRFEEYPDTDLATFMMKESERKTYPNDITVLGFYLPKNYNVGSCQMAFRRNLFPMLKFNPLFGINSGVFEVGEDELFHLSARKKGLKCRFFPDIIASHPHEASGFKKINNPKVIQGMGALIIKSYPISFLIRIPLKAYRLQQTKCYRLFPSLYHLIIGALKSFRVKV